MVPMLYSLCLASFCDVVLCVLSRCLQSSCWRRESWLLYFKCMLAFRCASVCLFTKAQPHGAIYRMIWAATCDFQQSSILTSVDTYKPVQLPFKHRNSKFCSISSLTVIEYSSDLQRLWSDCAYAQADLSLCWSHIGYHIVGNFMLRLICDFGISWSYSLIFFSPTFQHLKHLKQCLWTILQSKGPKLTGLAILNGIW